MSGNYIPFSGNSPAYGQGPQHLFFSGLGQAAPGPVGPAQAASPFVSQAEAYLGGMSGALGDMPAPSVPSPDQSLSGLGRAVGTALSFGLNPVGTTLGIAANAAMGRQGTGLMGALGALGSIGLADLNSKDRTETGLANAPDKTGGMVGSPFGMGLAAGPEGGKAGDAMGGSKGDAMGTGGEPSDSKGGTTADGGSKGSDGGTPGTDTGTPGDPGDTGSPSNLAGGGPVYLAGGGLTELPGGGKVAHGPGGGLDDLIPTSIDGRRAAKLSDGEFVIPADVVSMMGDGSSRAGSQRLYDLVKNVRQDKTGTNKQAGPLEVGAILRRVFK
jgi:hypothetical protein